MKRLPLFILLVLACLATAVFAVGPASTAATAGVEAVSLEQKAQPSFAEMVTPIPVLQEKARFGSLCIEPSPCQSNADCGFTLTGLPGVCVPNFDYPYVPSPKVCICP